MKIRAFPPRSSPEISWPTFSGHWPSLSSSPDPSHRLASTEPGQPPFSSHLEPSTFTPRSPSSTPNQPPLGQPPLFPLHRHHQIFFSVVSLRFLSKNNTDRSVQPPSTADSFATSRSSVVFTGDPAPLLASMNWPRLLLQQPSAKRRTTTIACPNREQHQSRQRNKANGSSFSSTTIVSNKSSPHRQEPLASTINNEAQLQIERSVWRVKERSRSTRRRWWKQENRWIGHVFFFSSFLCRRWHRHLQRNKTQISVLF